MIKPVFGIFIDAKNKSIIMKNRLKVTPIRKYKTPRYPSYFDESPLLMSRKVTKTGYYATALLGAFGLFAFSTNSNATAELKENPIKFKELGFPHTYAMYGTGLPDRLDRETAVDIIDSIFLANKIELSKEVPISKNGLSFNATGYNEKHNIGYVWLDHQSTASDCFNSWRSSLNKSALLPQDLDAHNKLMKEVGDSYEGYQKEKDFFENLIKQRGYYKLLKIKRYLWRNDALEQKIETYLRENKNYLDVDYGKEILEQYDNEKVDLKEMEQIVDEKDTSIATFSKYDSRFAYNSFGVYEKDENGKLVLKETDTKKEAIKDLENLVQEYIDWAKSEGRF